jgi:hypothetical protein
MFKELLALEAVLADIAGIGITEVVSLGDSRPLEARRTADLLMTRGYPSVRGDQDRLLIELGRAGTSNRAYYMPIAEVGNDSSPHPARG